jgi:hypothetical protein
MSSTETLSNAEHLTESERTCLRLCQEAVRVSELCADECARLDDVPPERRRLCRDVSDVAALHAALLARGSAHREALAGLCATVCRDCAAACESHEHENDTVRTTADVLRDCAEACDTMVK